jgi:hypothetical protein
MPLAGRYGLGMGQSLPLGKSAAYGQFKNMARRTFVLWHILSSIVPYQYHAVSILYFVRVYYSIVAPYAA